MAGYYVGAHAVAGGPPSWRRLILQGATAAAPFYGFTFSTLSWGLPNLSTFVISSPATVEGRVARGGEGHGRRRHSCPCRVVFGPWDAPGGSLCLGAPGPRLRNGQHIEMTGHGNAWAVRVETIDRVLP